MYVLNKKISTVFSASGARPGRCRGDSTNAPTEPRIPAGVGLGPAAHGHAGARQAAPRSLRLHGGGSLCLTPLAVGLGLGGRGPGAPQHLPLEKRPQVATFHQKPVHLWREPGARRAEASLPSLPFLRPSLRPSPPSSLPSRPIAPAPPPHLDLIVLAFLCSLRCSLTRAHSTPARGRSLRHPTPFTDAHGQFFLGVKSPS